MSTHSLKRALRKNSGYFYILPSLILIISFSLIPLCMTFYYSFTKFNVIQPPQWIGLKNYFSVFHDPFFKASVVNTILYTAVTVPAQTLLSLVFASLIATFFKNHFGSFARSTLFIPVISSMVLVGTVWKFMLGTDNGIVNRIITLLGGNGVNWLGGVKTSLISVCIVSIWKSVGYFLVIYYAGIMDIPKSYYEAAEVDGATPYQQFTRITIPLLKPITFLVVTLGTIWSFQVFDLVYVMTGGGPGTSTMTLVLSIYQAGFKKYTMGYATALSAILFFLILAVSLVQKFFFRDLDEGGR